MRCGMRIGQLRIRGSERMRISDASSISISTDRQTDKANSDGQVAWAETHSIVPLLDLVLCLVSGADTSSLDHHPFPFAIILITLPQDNPPVVDDCPAGTNDSR